MGSRAEPSAMNSPSGSAPVIASADDNIVRSAVPHGLWTNGLAPVAASDWSYHRAAHLIDRAGFGATPEEIARLAGMTPEQAVASLLDYSAVPNDHLASFDPSGVWDPSLRDFPPSRPAATERAEKTGESLGVRVKPAGERRPPPVVDRFFYLLRATRPQAQRPAACWAAAT